MQDEKRTGEWEASGDYEAPVVRDLGTLVELTQGGGCGDDADGFGGNPSC
jgi:hypothetical protein